MEAQILMEKITKKRFYLCAFACALCALFATIGILCLSSGRELKTGAGIGGGAENQGDILNCAGAQVVEFLTVNAGAASARGVVGQRANIGAAFVDEPVGTTEKTISVNQLGDFILYEYLMFLRDGKYPATESELTANPLKENDFADCETLDISDVHLEEYRISDVSGLGLFNLSALKHLDLSDNGLELIEASTFSGMQNLETLNLNGNQLKSVDFGVLQSVTNLYADSNRLLGVDLSILATNGKAMLRYNQIRDIRALNLQTDGRGATVDVYGNRINNYLAGVYQNYNLVIGFQYEYNKYNETNPVKITKLDGQDDYYLNCVNVHTCEVTRIDESANLIPATYEIIMCSAAGDLGYKPLTLKIEKSAPTITVADAEGNGVDYGQVITEEIVITFDSNDERYTVWYSINGAPFVCGNSVTLTESGTYSFSVRAQSADGDSSQITAFTVKLSIYNNKIWQFLLIMLGIFAFAGICYGAVWFYERKSKGNPIIKTNSKK